MTQSINAHLFAALTALLEANKDICLGGTLDYSQKDYTYIDDLHSQLTVQYFGRMPDGERESEYLIEMQDAGNTPMTDKEAFDLMMDRFNNTQIHNI